MTRSKSAVVRFILLVLVAGLICLATFTSADAAKRWVAMDCGPTMSLSLESSLPAKNIAYKGILVRLGDDKKATVAFDADLMRYSVGWDGGYINWRSIVYDGSHGTHPAVAGKQRFGNRATPGWAKAGSFKDPRVFRIDPNNKKAAPIAYGPMPRDWVQYKGLYMHGNRVVFSYTVGKTSVLDNPGLETKNGVTLFTRTLNIGKSSEDLALQVLENPAQSGSVASAKTLESIGAKGPANGNVVALKADGGATIVSVSGDTKGVTWEVTKGSEVRLHVPASSTPAKLKICIAAVTKDQSTAAATVATASKGPEDLSALTKGGPKRWAEKLTTKGKLGGDDRVYATDQIIAPMENPWNSWMRLGGFDFFKDPTKAAVCTWNGDVWIVEGIDDKLEKLTWTRIATGMFQPLGVKIVDETIYVTCRDQIARLHDLNGDGEIDFYECFNGDHQVTKHFHEFAMDLQTDKEGNFYYAKSARHAKDCIVPQHGTLMRVSKDGQKTEILCNGFRAANGVGIGPNGELMTSDQEGHWTPANRINMCKVGGFYGNLYSFHDHKRKVSDGYDPPLVWLPKNYDRSPASQLWVEGNKWGLPAGTMIHTSYGTGQLRVVMHETVDGTPQGAVCTLPTITYPTGVMRGRFRADDGQLYICGLFGWAGSRTYPGGFYRVRYTGKPVQLPVAVNVKKNGIAVTFTQPLDRESAENDDNYAVGQWNYRWTSRYGSAHYSVENPRKRGQDEVEIKSAKLSPDGKTVFLELEKVQPVMQMKITVNLKAKDGTPIKLSILNTINKVPK